jgi:hypothetical protein
MVRMHMMDRTPADNLLSGDLEFTDEEITAAMGASARSFNSLPPFSVRADPANLGADTNLFLDAIAWHLYRMLLHKLRRNAFDYQAGNVSVDTDKVKIQHLEKSVGELEVAWKTEATDLKTQIQIDGFHMRLV